MQARITDSYIKDQILRARSLPDGIFPPVNDLEVCDSVLAGFTLVVRRTGSMSFCLRYRNGHGVAKKYTIGKYGSISTAQARKVANFKSGEVLTGIDIQAERKRIRVEAREIRARTLGSFIDNKYKGWIVTERKSGQAILRRLETCFGDWFDRPMSDINVWLVTNWRTRRVREGAKPATVNRDISSLRALLSKAVEWGVIDIQPLRGFKKLRVDKSSITRFLTSDEEHRLRKALDDRQNLHREKRARYNEWRTVRHQEILTDLTEVSFTDHIKPIVLLALNTGMRRGELFNLKAGHINFEQRFLTVDGSGAKSGNSRIIPLNKEAYSILEQWFSEKHLGQGDYVFASPVTGERLDHLKRSWKRLMAMAHIERFRFHDLRHTFASNLVMRGADLYSVKELLGHANIETTQRYTHLAPEHKARVVELLVGT